MASPSFSIIVPTYQRRDMVCESLSALSKLTYYGPLEIIVVVNCSTDGTAEAVGRLDFRWPTLRR